MKKLLVLLTLLFVAIGLLGCESSSVEKVENNTAAAEVTNEDHKNNEATEEEAPAMPDKIAVGETINFDGLHITLNEVFTSEGSEWEKPSFDHYLVLDLTIENTTDKSASISTLLQMTLQDEEGYSHDIALFTETKGSLDGEIGPGRSNRGQIAFDVNQSSVYEFIFENPFTSGQAIWEVTVD